MSATTVKHKASRAACTEYVLFPSNETRNDLQMFLRDTRTLAVRHIRSHFKTFKGLKFQLAVSLTLGKHILKSSEFRELTVWFCSKQYSAYTRDPLRNLVKLAARDIVGFFDAFIMHGSGFILLELLELRVKCIDTILFSGGANLHILPKFIKHKRACLSIACTDNQCFVYAVLAAIYPVCKNASRIAHYRPYISTLNLRNISFPVHIKQITTFESQNDVSVNVFALEKRTVFPIYVTRCRDKTYHADLFLYQEHYYLIRSLSRLLSGIYRSKKIQRYVCSFCLANFNSSNNLDMHSKHCAHDGLRYTMPDKDSAIMCFENYSKQITAPFVFYVDFEAINIESDYVPSRKTLGLRHHLPVSFCALRVCRAAPKYNSEPVLYRGDDCIKHFFLYLEQQEYELRDILYNSVPMKWTRDAERAFRAQERCTLCLRKFGLYTPKVRDHCHISGAYRSALCSACNLTYASLKNIKFIIVMHGSVSYDMHFLLRDINLFSLESDISVIPRNSEKYLSFNIRDFIFIDSFQFLNASLQVLVSSLKEKGTDSFTFTNKFVPNLSQRDLVLRKGVFCYDFLDSLEKFDCVQLPERSLFFNKLTGDDISQADFLHAQKVWSLFHCKNLGEYHDVYLKSDVLLLADVFENYRTSIQKLYGLDPAWYISGPQLAFDACLKFTNVKIQLITDLDMYKFFEKGIRGGVANIPLRYARANNMYNPNYEPERVNSFILDLDMNSLYPYAMTEKLPIGDFRWLTRSEISSLDFNSISDDSSVGYVLEVDLSYPAYLHDIPCHQDYPLAPEKLSVSFDQLSPTAQAICKKLKLRNITKAVKLIPNFYGKVSYVLHYRNLKLYTQLGLVLENITRVIAFKQTAWLRAFINLNIQQRKAATNDFDVQMWKRMNCSLYGKLLQNCNRLSVHLVSEEKTLRRLASKATFSDFKILNQDLVSVQMKKATLRLNRPIFAGMCVLELSKLPIYRFHYYYMKKKYGDKARLLLTDTDSLVYHVETEDIYRDLLRDKSTFDFSNYPKKHYLYNTVNKRELGYFKDETAGICILEFVGLKPKMYSFYTHEMKSSKAAKGVKRSIINKITHQDYVHSLVHSCEMEHEYYSIQSKNHQLSTVHRTRKSLGCIDDKRYLLRDRIHTLPYGHYRYQSPCKRRKMHNLTGETALGMDHHSNSSPLRF